MVEDKGEDQERRVADDFREVHVASFSESCCLSLDHTLLFALKRRLDLSEVGYLAADPLPFWGEDQEQKRRRRCATRATKQKINQSDEVPAPV